MSPKKFAYRIYFVVVGLLFLSVAGINCDKLLTKPIEDGESFDGTLPDLSPSLNAAFARGDEAFEKVFTVSEGLGPIFNQPSCESCHAGDGRSPAANFLVRFSRGMDPAFDIGGGQLQDKSIPGVPAETLPPGVDTSVRIGPPVFGIGLIEEIPLETLLAMADPNDEDGDGISGRINWVMTENGAEAGRFGRKANVVTLIQQIATAYHQDIGITSDVIPEENEHPQAGGFASGDIAPDPELPMSVINDVAVYLRLLAPPKQGEKTQQVLRGEQVFADIGCASCHVPKLTTGVSKLAPLSNKEAYLYSDLLLHDMGPELADNRPDESATGTEWRTAPLWGLRIAGDPLGGVVPYLHDGRTTDITEAIRLHGGEAEQSRNNFLGLSNEDLQALIAFLLHL